MNPKVSFIKLSDGWVLQMVLHVLPGHCQNMASMSQQWFRDPHQREVYRLLEDPIRERLDVASRDKKHATASTTSNNKNNIKPAYQMLKGQTVKLSYRFKKRAVHQSCLLPRSMSAEKLCQSSYEGFKIFRDKLVIYVCPISYQDYWPFTSRKMTDISDYFSGQENKKAVSIGIKPLMADAGTSDRQKALRNIVKKSGPKISKSGRSKRKECQDIENTKGKRPRGDGDNMKPKTSAQGMVDPLSIVDDMDQVSDRSDSVTSEDLDTIMKLAHTKEILLDARAMTGTNTQCASSAVITRSPRSQGCDEASESSTGCVLRNMQREDDERRKRGDWSSGAGCADQDARCHVGIMKQEMGDESPALKKTVGDAADIDTYATFGEDSNLAPQVGHTIQSSASDIQSRHADMKILRPLFKQFRPKTAANAQQNTSPKSSEVDDGQKAIIPRKSSDALDHDKGKRKCSAKLKSLILSTFDSDVSGSEGDDKKDSTQPIRSPGRVYRMKMSHENSKPYRHKTSKQSKSRLTDTENGAGSQDYEKKEASGSQSFPHNIPNSPVFNKSQKSQKPPSMEETSSSQKSSAFSKKKETHKKASQNESIEVTNKLTVPVSNMSTKDNTFSMLMEKCRRRSKEIILKNLHREREKEVNSPDVIDVEIYHFSDGMTGEKEKLEDQIARLSEVNYLSAEQIHYIVVSSEKQLRQVFQGKVFNQRHEEYKKGGADRRMLDFQIHMGLFTEEQTEAAMDSLMSLFCKTHHKYLDYLLKVLLPEVLVLAYMKVHKTSYSQAEQNMHDACSIAGAIFT